MGLTRRRRSVRRRFGAVATGAPAGECGELAGVGGARDNAVREVGEALTMVPGVAAQRVEGLGDLDVQTFGKNAFGLLDEGLGP